MKRIIAISLLASGLIACGGAPKAPLVTLSAAEQAQYANKTPKEILAEASEEMKKAYAEEFKSYAPSALKNMEKALKSIQEGLKDDKLPKNHFAVQLKVIKKGLEDGLTTKGNVKNQLANVYDYRAVLDELTASKLYPGDYDDIQDDIMDLVELIEEKKFEKARKDAVGVIEDMTELEVKIFKAMILTKPENLLDQADDKGAEGLIEKAFEEAEKAYERAEQIIERNVRDREEVKRLGDAALFYAKRAVWMVDEVIHLQSINRNDLGSVPVEAEQRMKRIADALGHADVRDLSLAEQSNALAAAAEALRNKNKALNLENERLQQSSGTVTETAVEEAEPDAPEFNDENLADKQAELVKENDSEEAEVKAE